MIHFYFEYFLGVMTIFGLLNDVTSLWIMDYMIDGLYI